MDLGSWLVGVGDGRKEKGAAGTRTYGGWSWSMELEHGAGKRADVRRRERGMYVVCMCMCYVCTLSLSMRLGRIPITAKACQIYERDVRAGVVRNTDIWGNRPGRGLL